MAGEQAPDVREGCRYADIGGEGLIEEDQEVRYRTSISAYSREVLAATFNTHIEDLPDFPFTKSDPMIVNRHNPLDR